MQGMKFGFGNSSHLFWTCKQAREMWESSKLVMPFTSNQVCSFKDLLLSLCMEVEFYAATNAKSDVRSPSIQLVRWLPP